MSHEPRAPAVAWPLALALAGGREATLRRRFAAGLARLAGGGTDDPRAALEALAREVGRETGEEPEDCARAAIGRYNGRNDRTPDRAIRTEHEV